MRDFPDLMRDFPECERMAMASTVIQHDAIYTGYARHTGKLDQSIGWLQADGSVMLGTASPTREELQAAIADLDAWVGEVKLAREMGRRSDNTNNPLGLERAGKPPRLQPARAEPLPDPGDRLVELE